MEYQLTVSRLFKRFDDDEGDVVRDLSFQIAPGELFALLGPSGCGKSTTLRLIAGFVEPDRGEIVSASRVLVRDSVRLVPPEQRGIGMVFQDYALFPHLSVRQNVAFGLMGWKAEEKEDRLLETLNLLGLGPLTDRYPHELSGGQQQRVAIARSLAPRPSVILLDEPFSNLDARLRNETRSDIRSLLKKAGVTTILVTHDQEEAMSFADRIAVMRSGSIEQIGTPEEIYYQPATRFVAEFLGQTNILKSEASGQSAQTVLGDIPLNQRADGTVWISIRPEHLSLKSAGDQTEGTDAAPVGTVIHRAFKGHDITYTVAICDIPLLVHTSNRIDFSVGDHVQIVPLEAGTVVK